MITGRPLHTRWRRLGQRRWRLGLVRGEWWIGARYNLPTEWWMFGVLGVVVIVAREYD